MEIWNILYLIKEKVHLLIMGYRNWYKKNFRSTSVKSPHIYFLDNLQQKISLWYYHNNGKIMAILAHNHSKVKDPHRILWHSVENALKNYVFLVTLTSVFHGYQDKGYFYWMCTFGIHNNRNKKQSQHTKLQRQIITLNHTLSSNIPAFCILWLNLI